MRQTRNLGLAAILMAAGLTAGPALAQYYDDEAPPPRRGGYGYDRPVRPDSRRPVGLNCDAVQQGLSGPQPYSCPLPGPRPLGARCFCDMPIASFSAPQTAVGRVVP